MSVIGQVEVRQQADLSHGLHNKLGRNVQQLIAESLLHDKLKGHLRPLLRCIHASTPHADGATGKCISARGAMADPL